MAQIRSIQIDRVVRSRRRTFALVVEPDGRLVVRAPLRATQAQIDEMVKKNNAWIIKKQAIVLSHQASKPSHQFLEGETFPYLGKDYPLRIVERQVEPLALLEPGHPGGHFQLARSAQWNAAQLFKDWYTAQAGQVLLPRLTLLARQHALAYNQVRIKNIHSRWGSCSAKRNLNFNFRLVMAPVEVIDYVIIHELAHLKIRNHSPEFWLAVESLLPSYRLHRDWLKRHGHELQFI